MSDRASFGSARRSPSSSPLSPASATGGTAAVMGDREGQGERTRRQAQLLASRPAAISTQSQRGVYEEEDRGEKGPHKNYLQGKAQRAEADREGSEESCHQHERGNVRRSSTLSLVTPTTVLSSTMGLAVVGARHPASASAILGATHRICSEPISPLTLIGGNSASNLRLLAAGAGGHGGGGGGSVDRHHSSLSGRDDAEEGEGERHLAGRTEVGKEGEIHSTGMLQRQPPFSRGKDDRYDEEEEGRRSGVMRFLPSAAHFSTPTNAVGASAAAAVSPSTTTAHTGTQISLPSVSPFTPSPQTTTLLDRHGGDGTSAGFYGIVNDVLPVNTATPIMNTNEYRVAEATTPAQKDTMSSNTAVRTNNASRQIHHPATSVPLQRQQQTRAAFAHAQHAADLQRNLTSLPDLTPPTDNYYEAGEDDDYDEDFLGVVSDSSHQSQPFCRSQKLEGERESGKDQQSATEADGGSETHSNNYRGNMSGLLPFISSRQLQQQHPMRNDYTATAKSNAAGMMAAAPYDNGTPPRAAGPEDDDQRAESRGEESNFFTSGRPRNGNGENAEENESRVAASPSIGTDEAEAREYLSTLSSRRAACRGKNPPVNNNNIIRGGGGGDSSTLNLFSSPSSTDQVAPAGGENSAKCNPNSRNGGDVEGGGEDNSADPTSVLSFRPNRPIVHVVASSPHSFAAFNPSFGGGGGGQGGLGGATNTNDDDDINGPSSALAAPDKGSGKLLKNRKMSSGGDSSKTFGSPTFASPSPDSAPSIHFNASPLNVVNGEKKGVGEKGGIRHGKASSHNGNENDREERDLVIPRRDVFNNNGPAATSLANRPPLPTTATVCVSPTIVSQGEARREAPLSSSTAPLASSSVAPNSNATRPNDNNTRDVGDAHVPFAVSNRSRQVRSAAEEPSPQSIVMGGVRSADEPCAAAEEEIGEDGAESAAAGVGASFGVYNRPRITPDALASSLRAGSKQYSPTSTLRNRKAVAAASLSTTRAALLRSPTSSTGMDISQTSGPLGGAQNQNLFSPSHQSGLAIVVPEGQALPAPTTERRTAKRGQSAREQSGGGDYGKEPTTPRRKGRGGEGRGRGGGVSSDGGYERDSADYSSGESSRGSKSAAQRKVISVVVGAAADPPTRPNNDSQAKRGRGSDSIDTTAATDDSEDSNTKNSKRSTTTHQRGRREAAEQEALGGEAHTTERRQKREGAGKSGGAGIGGGGGGVFAGSASTMPFAPNTMRLPPTAAPTPFSGALVPVTSPQAGSPILEIRRRQEVSGGASSPLLTINRRFMQAVAGNSSATLHSLNGQRQHHGRGGGFGGFPMSTASPLHLSVSPSFGRAPRQALDWAGAGRGGAAATSTGTLDEDEHHQREIQGILGNSSGSLQRGASADQPDELGAIQSYSLSQYHQQHSGGAAAGGGESHDDELTAEELIEKDRLQFANELTAFVKKRKGCRLPSILCLIFFIIIIIFVLFLLSLILNLFTTLTNSATSSVKNQMAHLMFSMGTFDKTVVQTVVSMQLSAAKDVVATNYTNYSSNGLSAGNVGNLNASSSSLVDEGRGAAVFSSFLGAALTSGKMVTDAISQRQHQRRSVLIESSVPKFEELVNSDEEKSHVFANLAQEPGDKNATASVDGRRTLLRAHDGFSPLGSEETDMYSSTSAPAPVSAAVEAAINMLLQHIALCGAFASTPRGVRIYSRNMTVESSTHCGSYVSDNNETTADDQNAKTSGNMEGDDDSVMGATSNGGYFSAAAIEAESTAIINALLYGPHPFGNGDRGVIDEFFKYGGRTKHSGRRVDDEQQQQQTTALSSSSRRVFIADQYQHFTPPWWPSPNATEAQRMPPNPFYGGNLGINYGEYFLNLWEGEGNLNHNALVDNTKASKARSFSASSVVDGGRRLRRGHGVTSSSGKARYPDKETRAFLDILQRGVATNRAHSQESQEEGKRPRRSDGSFFPAATSQQSNATTDNTNSANVITSLDQVLSAIWATRFRQNTHYIAIFLMLMDGRTAVVVFDKDRFGPLLLMNSDPSLSTSSIQHQSYIGVIFDMDVNFWSNNYLFGEYYRYYTQEAIAGYEEEGYVRGSVTAAEQSTITNIFINGNPFEIDFGAIVYRNTPIISGAEDFTPTIVLHSLSSETPTYSSTTNSSVARRLEDYFMDVCDGGRAYTWHFISGTQANNASYQTYLDGAGDELGSSSSSSSSSLPTSLRTFYGFLTSPFAATSTLRPEPRIIASGIFPQTAVLCGVFCYDPESILGGSKFTPNNTAVGAGERCQIGNDANVYVVITSRIVDPTAAALMSAMIWSAIGVCIILIIMLLFVQAAVSVPVEILKREMVKAIVNGNESGIGRETSDDENDGDKAKASGRGRADDEEEEEDEEGDDEVERPSARARREEKRKQKRLRREEAERKRKEMERRELRTKYGRREDGSRRTTRSGGAQKSHSTVDDGPLSTPTSIKVIIVSGFDSAKFWIADRWLDFKHSKGFETTKRALRKVRRKARHYVGIITRPMWVGEILNLIRLFKMASTMTILIRKHTPEYVLAKQTAHLKAFIRRADVDIVGMTVRNLVKQLERAEESPAGQYGGGGTSSDGPSSAFGSYAEDQGELMASGNNESNPLGWGSSDSPPLSSPMSMAVMGGAAAPADWSASNSSRTLMSPAYASNTANGRVHQTLGIGNTTNRSTIPRIRSDDGQLARVGAGTSLAALGGLAMQHGSSSALVPITGEEGSYHHLHIHHSVSRGDNGAARRLLRGDSHLLPTPPDDFHPQRRAATVGFEDRLRERELGAQQRERERLDRISAPRQRIVFKGGGIGTAEHDDTEMANLGEEDGQQVEFEQQGAEPPFAAPREESPRQSGKGKKERGADTKGKEKEDSKFKRFAKSIVSAFTGGSKEAPSEKKKNEKRNITASSPRGKLQQNRNSSPRTRREEHRQVSGGSSSPASSSDGSHEMRRIESGRPVLLLEDRRRLSTSNRASPSTPTRTTTITGRAKASSPFLSEPHRTQSRVSDPVSGSRTVSRGNTPPLRQRTTSVVGDSTEGRRPSTSGEGGGYQEDDEGTTGDASNQHQHDGHVKNSSIFTNTTNNTIDVAVGLSSRNRRHPHELSLGKGYGVEEGAAFLVDGGGADRRTPTPYKGAENNTNNSKGEENGEEGHFDGQYSPKDGSSSPTNNSTHHGGPAPSISRLTGKTQGMNLLATAFAGGGDNRLGSSFGSRGGGAGPAGSFDANTISLDEAGPSGVAFVGAGPAASGSFSLRRVGSSVFSRSPNMGAAVGGVTKEQVGQNKNSRDDQKAFFSPRSLDDFDDDGELVGDAKLFRGKESGDDRDNATTSSPRGDLERAPLGAMRRPSHGSSAKNDIDAFGSERHQPSAIGPSSRSPTPRLLEFQPVRDKDGSSRAASPSPHHTHTISKKEGGSLTNRQGYGSDHSNPSQQQGQGRLSVTIDNAPNTRIALTPSMSSKVNNNSDTAATTRGQLPPHPTHVSSVKPTRVAKSYDDLTIIGGDPAGGGGGTSSRRKEENRGGKGVENKEVARMASSARNRPIMHSPSSAVLGGGGSGASPIPGDGPPLTSNNNKDNGEAPSQNTQPPNANTNSVSQRLQKNLRNSNSLGSSNGLHIEAFGPNKDIMGGSTSEMNTNTGGVGGVTNKVPSAVAASASGQSVSKRGAGGGGTTAITIPASPIGGVSNTTFANNKSLGGVPPNLTSANANAVVTVPPSTQAPGGRRGTAIGPHHHHHNRYEKLKFTEATIVVVKFAPTEAAYQFDFSSAAFEHNRTFGFLLTLFRGFGAEVFCKTGEMIAAAWNAFDSKPDHIRVGMRCAIDIASKFTEARRSGFMMGISVHSGPVVCGILEDKNASTSVVLGTTVDIAVQLADLGLDLPYFSILITDAIRTVVSIYYDCLIVDVVKFSEDRTRSLVDVFDVIGPSVINSEVYRKTRDPKLRALMEKVNRAKQEIFMHYNNAFNRFRSHQFKDALKIIDKMKIAMRADDVIQNMVTMIKLTGVTIPLFTVTEVTPTQYPYAPVERLQQMCQFFLRQKQLVETANQAAVKAANAAAIAAASAAVSAASAKQAEMAAAAAAAAVASAAANNVNNNSNAILGLSVGIDQQQQQGDRGAGYGMGSSAISSADGVGLLHSSLSGVENHNNNNNAAAAIGLHLNSTTTTNLSSRLGAMTSLSHQPHAFEPSVALSSFSNLANPKTIKLNRAALTELAKSVMNSHEITDALKDTVEKSRALLSLIKTNEFVTLALPYSRLLPRWKVYERLAEEFAEQEQRRLESRLASLLPHQRNRANRKLEKLRGGGHDDDDEDEEEDEDEHDELLLLGHEDEDEDEGEHEEIGAAAYARQQQRSQPSRRSAVGGGEERQQQSKISLSSQLVNPSNPVKRGTPPPQQQHEEAATRKAGVGGAEAGGSGSGSGSSSPKQSVSNRVPTSSTRTQRHQQQPSSSSVSYNNNNSISGVSVPLTAPPLAPPPIPPFSGSNTNTRSSPPQRASAFVPQQPSPSPSLLLPRDDKTVGVAAAPAASSGSATGGPHRTELPSAMSAGGGEGASRSGSGGGGVAGSKESFLQGPPSASAQPPSLRHVGKEGLSKNSSTSGRHPSPPQPAASRGGADKVGGVASTPNKAAGAVNSDNNNSQLNARSSSSSSGNNSNGSQLLAVPSRGHIMTHSRPPPIIIPNSAIAPNNVETEVNAVPSTAKAQQRQQMMMMSADAPAALSTVFSASSSRTTAASSAHQPTEQQSGEGTTFAVDDQENPNNAARATSLLQATPVASVDIEVSPMTATTIGAMNALTQTNATTLASAIVEENNKNNKETRKRMYGEEGQTTLLRTTTGSTTVPLSSAVPTPTTTTMTITPSRTPTTTTTTTLVSASSPLASANGKTDSRATTATTPAAATTPRGRGDDHHGERLPEEPPLPTLKIEPCDAAKPSGSSDHSGGEGKDITFDRTTVVDGSFGMIPKLVLEDGDDVNGGGHPIENKNEPNGPIRAQKKEALRLAASLGGIQQAQEGGLYSFASAPLSPPLLQSPATTATTTASTTTGSSPAPTTTIVTDTQTDLTSHSNLIKNDFLEIGARIANGLGPLDHSINSAVLHSPSLTTAAAVSPSTLLVGAAPSSALLLPTAAGRTPYSSRPSSPAIKPSRRESPTTQTQKSSPSPSAVGSPALLSGSGKQLKSLGGSRVGGPTPPPDLSMLLNMKENGGMGGAHSNGNTPNNNGIGNANNDTTAVADILLLGTSTPTSINQPSSNAMINVYGSHSKVQIFSQLQSSAAFFYNQSASSAKALLKGGSVPVGGGVGGAAIGGGGAAGGEDAENELRREIAEAARMTKEHRDQKLQQQQQQSVSNHNTTTTANTNNNNNSNNSASNNPHHWHHHYHSPGAAKSSSAVVANAQQNLNLGGKNTNTSNNNPNASPVSSGGKTALRAENANASPSPSSAQTDKDYDASPSTTIGTSATRRRARTVATVGRHKTPATNGGEDNHHDNKSIENRKENNKEGKEGGEEKDLHRRPSIKIYVDPNSDLARDEKRKNINDEEKVNDNGKVNPSDADKDGDTTEGGGPEAPLTLSVPLATAVAVVDSTLTPSRKLELRPDVEVSGGSSSGRISGVGGGGGGKECVRGVGGTGGDNSNTNNGSMTSTFSVNNVSPPVLIPISSGMSASSQAGVGFFAPGDAAPSKGDMKHGTRSSSPLVGRAAAVKEDGVVGVSQQKPHHHHHHFHKVDAADSFVSCTNSLESTDARYTYQQQQSRDDSGALDYVEGKERYSRQHTLADLPYTLQGHHNNNNPHDNSSFISCTNSLESTHPRSEFVLDHHDDDDGDVTQSFEGSSRRPLPSKLNLTTLRKRNVAESDGDDEDLLTSTTAVRINAMPLTARAKAVTVSSSSAGNKTNNNDYEKMDNNNDGDLKKDGRGGAGAAHNNNKNNDVATFVSVTNSLMSTESEGEPDEEEAEEHDGKNTAGSLNSSYSSAGSPTLPAGANVRGSTSVFQETTTAGDKQQQQQQQQQGNSNDNKGMGGVVDSQQHSGSQISGNGGDQASRISSGDASRSNSRPPIAPHKKKTEETKPNKVSDPNNNDNNNPQQTSTADAAVEGRRRKKKRRPPTLSGAVATGEHTADSNAAAIMALSASMSIGMSLGGARGEKGGVGASGTIGGTIPRSATGTLQHFNATLQAITHTRTLPTEIKASDGTIFTRSDQMLGAGSYGRVFLGMEKHTAKLVALKFMPLPDDPEEIEKLLNEVIVMQTVRDQYLVEFLGYCITPPFIVIVMECIVAGSLSTMLKSFQRFEDATVINFMKHILRGLAKLHEAGIIHRDVKPQNVLVSTTGICKISDFGASARISALARSAQEGILIQGTPLYLAPEAARGQPVLKSDIWSVGIMFLQLITGKVPFEVDETVMRNPVLFAYNIAKGSLRPKIPSRPTRQISAPALEFARKCLAENPDDRLSAVELLTLPYFYQ